MIRAVVEDHRHGTTTEVICRRFQNTVAEIVLHSCLRIRAAAGLNRVVLSGGVLMNELLAMDAMSQLQANDFVVYRHQKVPTNDGGISLGQLAVAAAQKEEKGQEKLTIQ